MKIGHWFVVISLILGAALSACAAPGEAAPSPAPERQAPTTAAVPKGQSTREQILVEAAKAAGEKEVVMWTFTWYWGPVEQAFQAKYPFLKLKVVDMSVELEPRVIEEYKAGKHSVDVIEAPYRRVIRLKDAGVLQEYAFPNWPNTWPSQPSQNYWRNHTGTFYAPAYNTGLVRGDEAPKTWEELADAKWRGRSIISVSSGSDILLSHMYINGDLTAGSVNWEKSTNYWKKVVENIRPSIGLGFKSPLDMVVVGDASLMLMAASSTGLYNIRRGAPMAYAPFKQAPAFYYSIALPKNPVHSNAAQLLIDFLTSEEGNLILANLFPNPSLHPAVAKKAIGNQYPSSLGIQMVFPPLDLLSEETITKADGIWVRDIIGRR